MKKITNVEETELRDEQLDAVSGGSPSLWDILGPAIEQTVNAGKPPVYGEITVY